MLKLVGCLMIVTVTSVVGFSLANEFKEREKILENFISALYIIKKEISFSINSLGDIFMCIAAVKLAVVSDLFSGMTKLIAEKNGIGIYEAWVETSGNMRIKLSLEDMSVLDTFFKVLGSSDRENEICNIDKTINVLESKLIEAKVSSDKNMTMYRVVGFTSGIAIVIFLV